MNLCTPHARTPHGIWDVIVCVCVCVVVEKASPCFIAQMGFFCTSSAGPFLKEGHPRLIKLSVSMRWSHTHTHAVKDSIVLEEKKKGANNSSICCGASLDAELNSVGNM